MEQPGDDGHLTIAIVGHVDHGKSTIVGRLLADTRSLPAGKLEQVQAFCARRGRPVEYAMLVDALREERSQGITIETARVFFKSDRRDYLIMDAPGHVAFMRNMVTGAARADAAVLVIDAQEGVRETTRRHGYLLWQLGIRDVVVLINKMDLVAYSQDRFASVGAELAAFLAGVGVEPRGYIPVSGPAGDNIAIPSTRMPWYHGPTLLSELDRIEKVEAPGALPLRLPVQAVYRFGGDDDRRIVAGRVVAGRLTCGDELVFLPSGQRSRVASIQAYGDNPPQTVWAGQSTGLTLTDPIYVQRGEVATRVGDALPRLARRLRVSIFWLDHEPMRLGATYVLKLATAKARATLTGIQRVMDEADLRPRSDARSIQACEVAECTLELASPIACDLIGDIVETARFVIVDNHAIRGGGIVIGVTEEGLREVAPDRNRSDAIGARERARHYGQQPACIFLVSELADLAKQAARSIDALLLAEGRAVYRLELPATDQPGFGQTLASLLDAGLLVVVSASDSSRQEVRRLHDELNGAHSLIVWLGNASPSWPAPETVTIDGADGCGRIRQILAERGIVTGDQATSSPRAGGPDRCRSANPDGSPNGDKPAGS
jgi:bifunctional enzyme CysN/CysC